MSSVDPPVTNVTPTHGLVVDMELPGRACDPHGCSPSARRALLDELGRREMSSELTVELTRQHYERPQPAFCGLLSGRRDSRSAWAQCLLFGGRG